MTHEFDRTDALLADIRDLVRHANLTTARWREAFFDRTDRTQQLAAKAIVIRALRLPVRLREAMRGSGAATRMARHPRSGAWPA
nr:hypothetical protein BJQ95_03059 [Cryobacterium sp. SO1]